MQIPLSMIRHLRDLSSQQWRSGLAAWLGWTFDGLDMHLYTLVYVQFVAQLLGITDTRDPAVGRYGSLIQGAFLLGWALGGGFFGLFGQVGDCRLSLLLAGGVPAGGGCGAASARAPRRRRAVGQPD